MAFVLKSKAGTNVEHITFKLDVQNQFAGNYFCAHYIFKRFVGKRVMVQGRHPRTKANKVVLGKVKVMRLLLNRFTQYFNCAHVLTIGKPPSLVKASAVFNMLYFNGLGTSSSSGTLKRKCWAANSSPGGSF